MEYKPLSGREFPRFSAIKTFFRLPHVELNPDLDVAVFGIPFDGGASYRPGTRFAPSQVREASSLGRGFHMGRALNIFQNLNVADIGDCPVVPIHAAQTYEKIENFVDGILKQKIKTVACGGDHSVTLPILRAMKKHYKKPLAFIHFDAHLDTYPAAWGIEVHHGSFLRHAIEEKLIDPKKTIQIGIRGPFAGQEDLDFVKKHKVKVFTIDDIRKTDIHSFIKKLPAFLDTPTYMSFDVDCLDPAYAPGTGTPVIGGMTSYEAQLILRALKIKNLVGGDVVEVSPPYDHSDITSLMAVDVMFEMMSIMAGH